MSCTHLGKTDKSSYRVAFQINVSLIFLSGVIMNVVSLYKCVEEGKWPKDSIFFSVLIKYGN